MCMLYEWETWVINGAERKVNAITFRCVYVRREESLLRPTDNQIRISA